MMLSLWILCASFLVSTSSFVSTYPMKQQQVRLVNQDSITNKIDPQNLAMLMTQALIQKANELEEQIAAASYNDIDDLALHYKRSPFSAWGGKRSQGSKFSAWGGKRAGKAAFSAWGGRR